MIFLWYQYQPVAAIAVVVAVDNIILEDGTNLLLEDNGLILLE